MADLNDKVDGVLAAFNKSAIRNIGTADLEILLATLTTTNDLRADDDAKKERGNVLAVLGMFNYLRKNIEAADRDKVIAVLDSFNELQTDIGTTIKTPEQILDRMDSMFPLA